MKEIKIYSVSSAPFRLYKTNPMTLDLYATGTVTTGATAWVD